MGGGDNNPPTLTTLFSLLRDRVCGLSDPPASAYQAADNTGTIPQGPARHIVDQWLDTRGAVTAHGGRETANGTEPRAGVHTLGPSTEALLQDSPPCGDWRRKASQPQERTEVRGAYHDDVPIVDDRELKQGHCGGSGVHLRPMSKALSVPEQVLAGTPATQPITPAPKGVPFA